MSTHREQRTVPDEDRLHALDVIRSWPEESRKPASWIIHVHREPDKVSESELVWEAVGPWQRIVAMREFETRDWPAAHTASVRSVIRYHVSPDRAPALADLDLAIEVDHDHGSVETVGPDLRTNLLALNLMHDVVTGALAPRDARNRYADVTTTTPADQPPPDMVKCRFDDQAVTEPAPVPPSDPSGSTSGDPGESSGEDPEPSSGSIDPGVHEAMPSPQHSEPSREKDTDGVGERQKTRRHGGGDVDEAAERSSGFDLDDPAADDRRQQPSTS